MKDKKIRDSLKQAQEAVEQANRALTDVMQELDDDALDAVAGGGDPFSQLPRVPTQSVDPNLRDKG